MPAMADLSKPSTPPLAPARVFQSALSPTFGAPSTPEVWQAPQYLVTTSAPVSAGPAAATATAPTPLHSSPAIQTWATGLMRSAIAASCADSASAATTGTLTANRANTATCAVRIFLIRFTRTPSSWLVRPATTVCASKSSIAGSPARRNNPKCRRVISPATARKSTATARSLRAPLRLNAVDNQRA